MTEGRLDTAHETWDRWWGDAKERAQWRHAERVVAELIPGLHAKGATRVLDVGAGIGRHSLAYARVGFEVVAIDASATGLDALVRSAAEEGLSIDAHKAPFTALPLEDSSVDHVLAWNVLYHGDRRIAAEGLTECRRVLAGGGTLQVTMLSKRHRAFGVGREIRPGTFIDETSTGDKEHPHLYVDASGLCLLLAETGFEPLSIVDLDQSPPGGWHWTVLAETSP